MPLLFCRLPAYTFSETLNRQTFFWIAELLKKFNQYWYPCNTPRWVSDDWIYIYHVGMYHWTLRWVLYGTMAGPTRGVLRKRLEQYSTPESRAQSELWRQRPWNQVGIKTEYYRFFFVPCGMRGQRIGRRGIMLLHVQNSTCEKEVVPWWPCDYLVATASTCLWVWSRPRRQAYPDLRSVGHDIMLWSLKQASSINFCTQSQRL